MEVEEFKFGDFIIEKKTSKVKIYGCLGESPDGINLVYISKQSKAKFIQSLSKYFKKLDQNELKLYSDIIQIIQTEIFNYYLSPCNLKPGSKVIIREIFKTEEKHQNEAFIIALGTNIPPNVTTFTPSPFLNCTVYFKLNGKMLHAFADLYCLQISKSK